MIDVEPSPLRWRVGAGTVSAPSPLPAICGSGGFRAVGGARRLGLSPTPVIDIIVCLRGSHSLSLGLGFLHWKMEHLD